MTNREWLNSIDNKAMAIKIVPPHSECEYCIINAECNHAGACIDKLIEWLGKEHIESMPEIRVGDVLRFKFDNSDEVYIASVVGEGYMYSSDSGYGLAEIDDTHYKIVEVWRFNGKILKTIWRADND